ncbi:MAG: hypothetical protein ACYTFI_04155 [Planctomycetota bacterium]
MRQIISDNFEHVLCALLLLSRLGDIVSTYLVTPDLKLEANPIARKLGWRFMALTVLACLLPYYNTALAVMALVPFLLISASNAGKIWFTRTMGESQYLDMLLRIARKSRLSHAICGVLASSSFIVLAGAVLCFLSPDPGRDWGYWFGLGIVFYGTIVALYGSLYFVRLFRKARNAPGEHPATDS